MNAMKQLQKLLLLLCLVTIGAQATWAQITWNINIYNSDYEFGEASSNKSRASKGETVTLTLKPHTYSQLISARVSCVTSGNNVPLTKTGNYTYSFQMPEESVNVRVRFGQPAELVTDVMLIGSKGQDVVNNLKNQYMAEGWKFLNYDLNEGAGGAFIYLLYKSENTCFDSNNNFVTDFYIKISGSQGRPETITHNGRTYIPVPGGGGNAFIADNVQCDLNYDANGKYIYLYYTKDPFEDGRAVCYIDFNDGSDGAVRANGGTSAADLNSGTGGVWLDHRAIYMHFTREFPPIAPEQAIWCSGNKTLYFVNNIPGQSYAQGDTYQGQTVTNVWSGTNVTNVGWGTPKWNAIAADVERVVFDKTFTWVRPKSLFKWFCFMNNLEEIEGLEYLNTSEVTNMNSMFYECYKLTTLDLNKFDVSKVTNATSMFQYTTRLTTIYCDNVWNITTAADMFASTYNLAGAVNYSGSKTDGNMANPITGYFTSRTTLVDNEDNSSLLTARNQYYGNVTIEGRSLVRNNTWNTLCLPFNVYDGDEGDNKSFTGTPLEGATVKTLSSSSFDANTGTMTMNFGSANTIEAGKPYIVKWESGEKIENPVFNKVTINNQINNVETNAVTFCGVFKPFILEANDNTKLYMGNNNTLYYPSKERTINSFRAYFQLADGITAGNLTSGTQGIKAFVLDFDNEQTTGIIGAAINDNEEMTSDKWYTLDGRRLAGKPTQKGVYINNGSKVVIK